MIPGGSIVLPGLITIVGDTTPAGMGPEVLLTGTVFSGGLAEPESSSAALTGVEAEEFPERRN